MDKIYFANQVEEILEKIDFSILGKNVGIKLHFGEKGCTTFISPEIARKVYDKMISLNKKPTLIECNVL
ncbi:MAG: hypothetical protein Q8N88_00905, partial [Nanoarchaeota archaeon]|nr:hypothetical protein [Nanoarchaeota archaeon]